jgi:hypothetical protein
MKPLRNPIVVAILALAAVALIFRNALGPLWERWRAPKAQIAAPAAPPVVPTNQLFAVTNAASVTTNAPPRVEAWNKLELVKDWTRAPKRDPFLFVPLPQTLNVVLNTNLPTLTKPVKSAQETLVLKAIWLQTGSNLAVINNRIVEEGSSILDYKVDKIEADKVWVTGPIGQERVFWGVGTNAPPSTNLPPMNLQGVISAPNSPEPKLSSSEKKN